MKKKKKKIGCKWCKGARNQFVTIFYYAHCVRRVLRDTCVLYNALWFFLSVGEQGRTQFHWMPA